MSVSSPTRFTFDDSSSIHTVATSVPDDPYHHQSHSGMKAIYERRPLPLPPSDSDASSLALESFFPRPPARGAGPADRSYAYRARDDESAWDDVSHVDDAWPPVDDAEFEIAALRRQVQQLTMALRQKNRTSPPRLNASPISPDESASNVDAGRLDDLTRKVEALESLLAPVRARTSSSATAREAPESISARSCSPAASAFNYNATGPVAASSASTLSVDGPTRKNSKFTRLFRAVGAPQDTGKRQSDAPRQKLKQGPGRGRVYLAPPKA